MHGYGASREVRVDEQGLEREMSRDKLINSRVQQVTQVDATRARASRGLCGHDCREEEARVIEPMNDATGSMYSSPNTSRKSTFSARQEQVTLDCLTRCFAMSECKFGMLDFASNVAGQHCSNIAGLARYVRRACYRITNRECECRHVVSYRKPYSRVETMCEIVNHES